MLKADLICPPGGSRRAGRWAVAGLAATLPALVPDGAARAQLLPQMGTTVELGDLRRAFERAYGPVGVAPGQPNWTVTPSIDVELRATDNARTLSYATTGRGQQSEFVTNVTPSLLIQGASQRLTGSFSFAPQLRFYANDSRQNSVGQNLNGSARATIFEDLLFINASAYANEMSRAGGLGQGTGGNIARQDLVKTSSFSFGPEMRHAFRDYGVAELAYTYTFLTRSGQNLRTNTPFATALTPGDTSTNTTRASFTSGQEFGRINFGLSVLRIDYDGPGALRGAARQTETLDLGYAYTHSLTLLGQVGHQDIRYGGVRPIRINDGLWSIGLRWNPDPDTTMTARFGHRDGGTNYFFEGSTAPTGRTRVSASYSEGMVSPTDELQASLSRSQVAGPALVVDPVTGMPVLVTNNFGGTQGGISRLARATVSAVLLQDIDTFSLSFNRDDRTTLSAEIPGATPAYTYYSTSVSWQRELSPGLRGNAKATYGSRTAKGVASQDIMTFTTGLTWALSETLSTRATYTYTRAASPQRGFSYEGSLISLGVRKTF